MPVKWDASKDQFILLTLIADESIGINKKHYDNILKAWPDALGEVPTQRAISEHFIKLRAQLKKDGVNAPSTPGSTTKGGGAKKATPAKTTMLETPTRGKKRPAESDSDDDDVAKLVKSEGLETDAVAGTDVVHGSGNTPGVRTRLPRSSKTPEARARVQKMMRYEEMDGDAGDASESDAVVAAEEDDSDSGELKVE